jgi:hypothetical protein
MMPQSVNFLKVLPKSINRIPLWLMAVMIVVPLLCLLFLFISAYISYTRVYANLNQQEERLKSAQITYNNLIHKYPLLVTNTPLLNQVSDLELEYNAKFEKFHSLKHLIVRPGFSKYLLNLGQVTPNTIWLDGIHINHNASLVTLKGYAIHPDSISELMSNLSTTVAFREVIFNSFLVKSIKDHAYARFSISTSEVIPEADIIIESQAGTNQQNQTTKAKE